MVLSKPELIARLRHEVHVLEHLISTADPAMLQYRPATGQRSLLELLRYLTVFPQIHLKTIHAGRFDMDAWGQAWQDENAKAAERDLDGIRAAIAGQPALFDTFIEPLGDGDLRSEMVMFGSPGTRGSWLVWLVLCHYSAYRMQLFLYLKASGREELNTMDLWAGVHGSA